MIHLYNFAHMFVSVNNRPGVVPDHWNDYDTLEVVFCMIISTGARCALFSTNALIQCLFCSHPVVTSHAHTGTLAAKKRCTRDMQHSTRSGLIRFDL
jgi:hypothetical protein